MDDKFINYLSTLKNFSGSVLVAKAGEVIFKSGFGFARAGVKNTPQTNYGIGSITKSFTALAIMQLVEKNLLKLDDKIVHFFPNIYPHQNLTVHHLLNQTSGIHNYIFDKRLQTGEDFTAKQILEFVLEKPLKFTPGQKWLYSNTNYLLLAQLIEKVSTKTYQEYLREEIFSQVGMNNTYFDGEKEDQKAQPGLAVFDCKPSLLVGAGDIVSNVEDLFLYDQALSTDQLASTASIKKMQSISYKGLLIKYGYGWFVNHHFSERSISHGGFHPGGYTSHFERFIDDRLIIIVLSNELKKYSRLAVKYFNSTDLGREIAAKAYRKVAFPWQKFN